MDAPQPADGQDPSNVPSPESNPELPSAARPEAAARVGLNRNELRGEDFLAANGIAQLIVVDSTGSTNADLLQGVTVDPHAWPDLSVLTAEHQTAARGRLDRHWEAPPLSSVSVSVVLRPVNSEGRPLPTHSYSWFSLLAALALREALLETAGIPAEIKWPNDVMVRGRKIAGILAQLGPMGDGTVPPVILGTGLNVTLTASPNSLFPRPPPCCWKAPGPSTGPHCSRATFRALPPSTAISAMPTAIPPPGWPAGRRCTSGLNR